MAAFMLEAAENVSSKRGAIQCAAQDVVDVVRFESEAGCTAHK